MLSGADETSEYISFDPKRQSILISLEKISDSFTDLNIEIYISLQTAMEEEKASVSIIYMIKEKKILPEASLIHYKTDAWCSWVKNEMIEKLAGTVSIDLTADGYDLLALIDGVPVPATDSSACGSNHGYDLYFTFTDITGIKFDVRDLDGNVGEFITFSFQLENSKSRSIDLRGLLTIGSSSLQSKSYHYQISTRTFNYINNYRLVAILSHAFFQIANLAKSTVFPLPLAK